MTYDHFRFKVASKTLSELGIEILKGEVSLVCRSVVCLSICLSLPSSLPTPFLLSFPLSSSPLPYFPLFFSILSLLAGTPYVDKAGFELTEIHLLASECWDSRSAPQGPANSRLLSTHVSWRVVMIGNLCCTKLAVSRGSFYLSGHFPASRRPFVTG